jgi:peptidoglycan lytic transglycosylase B
MPKMGFFVKGFVMKRVLLAIVTLSLLHLSLNLQASQAFIKRKDVKAFISDMVKNHHFDKAKLEKTLSKANVRPKIIDSMKRPYEKKPWNVYKKLFLNPKRVRLGIEFWENNKPLLQRAEKQYGIPANIIVAILGVETYYGRVQGNHRVLDALATLAFNYPSRARFFKKELKEYLLLCREQHIDPTSLFGSYAGAIGQPQFMPSSYRYYAVDFTGNGKKDLLKSNADAIGSVANYFKRHGWHKNQAITQPALVKGKKHRRVNLRAKKANYSVKRLARFGIKAKDASFNQPKKAGLIKLTSTDKTEYWLAYPNFYVITRYNTSKQYAMAVYLLAQELKKQWAQLHPPEHAFA